MSTKLIELTSWEQLTVPDVYFSYAYHVASANLEIEGTKPVLIEVWVPGGVFRLPLLIRPLDGGRWDATSCYGYGGPWWEGEGQPAGIREAIDLWAKDRGVVCTFLRLHPSRDNRALAAGCFEVVDLAQTVEWPVDPSIDLLSGMKKKHRQYSRKSEREGLTSTIVVNPTNLDEFVHLYRGSMDRLEAGDFYRFPDRYWESIGGASGCEIILSNIDLDGETVASLLCLSGDDLLHAHLLGTSDSGRVMKANYLAYITAAQWAQENSKSAFHLGGGYGGGGDDLLRWKQGFCPTAEPRQFSVAKAVHDKHAYRELAGTDSTDGYFPPWRRPNS